MFVLLMFSASIAKSQTQNDILDYDFHRYSGKPIERGWLFSKPFYTKIYSSIQIKDARIKQLTTNDSLCNVASTNKDKEIKIINDRVKLRDAQIAKDSVTIVKLKESFDEEKKLSGTKIEKGKYRRDMAYMGVGSFGLGSIFSLIMIAVLSK